MGSVHSKEASSMKSAYVAAKHALLGLTRSVAKEAGPYNVGCNLVCPGFVRTELVEAQIPVQAAKFGESLEQVEKRLLSGTVDGKWSTVEDVADCAHFFANFPTNALTGQSLNVSHGWNMQ